MSVGLCRRNRAQTAGTLRSSCTGSCSPRAAAESSTSPTCDMFQTLASVRLFKPFRASSFPPLHFCQFLTLPNFPIHLPHPSYPSYTFSLSLCSPPFFLIKTGKTICRAFQVILNNCISAVMCVYHVRDNLFHAAHFAP